MRRLGLFLLATLSSLLASDTLPDSAGEESARGFDGVWLGEIVGPNARATFGLAFTSTDRGRLVSVYFPEMFLFSTNFGRAEIAGDTFRLPPLDLTLRRKGDVLEGTFAPGQLPVKLSRGGNFAPEPSAPELPAAPAPRWTLALGAGAWATPAVAEQTLYVGTVDGKMHAVGADGREVWTWSGATPLYGEALVSSEAVYFVDAANVLTALARPDGKLLWRLPLSAAPMPVGEDGKPRDPTFNHRTAVPVGDGKGQLYVGSADGFVWAIRARTGKAVWKQAVKTPVFAPLALNGEDLWVGGFDGSVVRLNRRTHAETLRVRLGGGISSAPVVAGPHVIVGCRDYQLYGLTAKDGRTAWRNTYWFSWVESTPRLAEGWMYIGGSDFRRVSALKPSSGERRWATDVRGLSWGRPLVVGDAVYAGTAGQTIEGTVIQHTGGIVALDRDTGAVRWRYRPAAPAGAPFTGFAGSLVTIGDLIVGAGVDGTLVAFPLP